MNITAAMYGISQALREIANDFYHGNSNLTVLLPKVVTIEHSLDAALAQASSYIQGFNESSGQNSATIAAGDTFWVSWQMCMLRLRYLHAKEALYYPFFLHCEQVKQLPPNEPFVAQSASKCTETSRQLIREVFRAYKTHIFQRTWVYYSVYLVRALAVVLTSMTRTIGDERQVSQDRDSIIQALHVLDALDSNAVPRRIANFAREYLTLLAKSGKVAPPSPLKDRFQGPPPPFGHMSNFDDHLPPPPAMGNFEDHLHPPPPPPQAVPLYHRAPMNGFTMTPGQNLGPAPHFLPSQNMSFHAGAL
jgi:hypothetical protein